MKILISNVSENEADQIARTVVEERLAACVNSLPVRSVYRWNGAVQVEREVTLLMKVSSERVDALRDRVRQLHSYELPELIVLDVDVAHSLEAYVDWVEKECGE